LSRKPLLLHSWWKLLLVFVCNSGMGAFAHSQSLDLPVETAPIDAHDAGIRGNRSTGMVISTPVSVL
jgi:hypothetical protein